MKASELCPRTHHFLAEIFKEAGVPDAVLNVIQCRRENAAEVTEALIAHEDIRKIEFIGSAAVGKVIGTLCGVYLKPVFMELGGKCSAIVLDERICRTQLKNVSLGVSSPSQIILSHMLIMLNSSLHAPRAKLLLN